MGDMDWMFYCGFILFFSDAFFTTLYSKFRRHWIQCGATSPDTKAVEAKANPENNSTLDPVTPKL